MSSLVNRTYTIPYSISSQYTYDPTKIEIVDGKAQLIDYRLPDSTFAASYNIDINGSYGNGVLTGTAFGGASITGGELDLTGGTAKYVAYTAVGNADNQQTGAIRFKYRPNYTGVPPGTYALFAIGDAPASNVNVILLIHISGTGLMLLLIGDSTGAVFVVGILGNWLPTSGQQYELELNFDINVANPETRFFIDGTQFGPTQTNAGIRDSNINVFNVGNDTGGSSISNAKFDDFVVFDQVQHTANYTPGYIVADSAFANDDPIVQLNSPLTDNEIIGYRGFTETLGSGNQGSVGYRLNGQYWDGSQWIADAVNFNTATEVNNNINFFEIASQSILPSALLISDGTQRVELDLNTIEYQKRIIENVGIDLVLEVGDQEVYDLEFTTEGDLKATDSIDTALLMSLFTDKRADSSEIREAGQRRGWFGDLFNDDPNYKTGSKIWLHIDQGIVDEGTLSNINDKALNSLNWMIEDSIVDDIKIFSSIKSNTEIEIKIQFFIGDNVIERNFILWENSRWQ